ncbi:hypothetical protein PHISCL_06181 [Aspergillus sclerotialis]|uniref:Uncharacterized protein n=1 Tax=Aspergillus sclerotialis TaxID=2070753 RepID=A0A3A2ZEV3_9EURO|nr:hypothetical protein PHISCL_06181 [Aspergillus sclerotialis]
MAPKTRKKIQKAPRAVHPIVTVPEYLFCCCCFPTSIEEHPGLSDVTTEFMNQSLAQATDVFVAEWEDTCAFANPDRRWALAHFSSWNPDRYCSALPDSDWMLKGNEILAGEDDELVSTAIYDGLATPEPSEYESERDELNKTVNPTEPNEKTGGTKRKEFEDSDSKQTSSKRRKIGNVTISSINDLIDVVATIASRPSPSS